MDSYRGSATGIQRRVEVNYDETRGFSFIDEYIGPRPTIEDRIQEAERCGFASATVEEMSPGSGLWRARLTYIGREDRRDAVVRPLIEEQTSHWLLQSRYERLPLWRHPYYEPLTECSVSLGRAVWEIENEGEDNETWTPVDLPPPDRTIETNEQFPYAEMVRLAVNAWKSGISGQLGQLFSNVMLQVPAINEIIIAGNIPNRVNLTEQFDIAKHLVTQIRETTTDDVTQRYRYQLLPVSSTSARNLTANRLQILAQNFAEELLANRDTAEWDRGTIANDRVVATTAGLNLNLKGVNQIWTSPQIAAVITAQRERRALERQRSPIVCRDIDGTMEDIKFELDNSKRNSIWLRRRPHVRQTGRGRLEVRDEWEEKRRWEFNRNLFPDYLSPTGRAFDSGAILNFPFP